MTKEQEKAILYLEYMNKNIDFNKIGYVYAKEMIETVLNMLKEKDKEIEKKDKIIDLMTEYINYLSDELVQATGKNELDFCDGNKCCEDSDYSCEECIKQYFERKASR